MIIVGWILIAFEALGVLGAAKSGHLNFAGGLYGLGQIVGFCLPALLGIILLIAGYSKRNKKKAAVSRGMGSSTNTNNFGGEEHFQLRWISGPLAGQQTPVYGQITIGREAENDVVLPASTKGVSRKHCLVAVADGKLYIEDLGSAYGTVGNGLHKLPANQVVLVNPGDRISLGSEEVAFVVEKSGMNGFSQYNPLPKAASEKKPKKGKTGLIVVCVVITLLLAALAVCYKMGIIGENLISKITGSSSQSSEIVETPEPTPTPTPSTMEAPSAKPSTNPTPTTTPKPSSTPKPIATPSVAQSGKDTAEDRIDLHYTGNRYNAGLWTVPVLTPEEEVLNCTGFTLYFCYDRVDKQELGTQRVFVSLDQRNGAWLDCGTFNVEKEGEVYSTNIKFDKPRTVGGIAVLSTNATESSYSVTAWIQDLKYA